MKKVTFLLLSLVATQFGGAANAALLAAWNFNTLSIATAGVPGTGTIPSTITASSGTGSLSLTGYAGNIDDFAGSTVNAVAPDPAGPSLSLVGGGPSGGPYPGNDGFLDFTISTAGFAAPTLTYASQRTATGFTDQAFSYSIDSGATFVPASTVTGLPSSFALQTVTFPAATANVGSLIVRMTVTGVTSNSGNNRLDNVQFNAEAIPEPATLALAGVAILGAVVTRRRA